MARQLPLRLVHEAAQTRENFIISDANREAFSWIEQWPHWPSHCLIIYGPEACGKTHLAQVWRERAGAKFLRSPLAGEQARPQAESWGVKHKQGCTPPDSTTACSLVEPALPQGEGVNVLVEDVHSDTDETSLFHLFNRVKEQGGYLLLTMREAPAAMGFRLPDLSSRLLSCPAVAIGAPDENLIRSLMIKSFSDSQLKVNHEVVDYIVPRIERSFAAVHALVEKLDARALEDHRNITIPLVREVLESGREQRIKKILYRTWYRGCKETDQILGNFAKEHAPGMADAELDQLEAILEEQDTDIYNWLTAKEPLPERYKGNQIMEGLMKFRITAGE